METSFGISQFERIKNVDDKFKFTVYGFIRMCQSLLPFDGENVVMMAAILRDGIEIYFISFKNE